MHTDRTYRTPRPSREITFIDFRVEEIDGEDVVVIDTETITQEFGRRAGLHTHKSDARDRRVAAIRRARRRDRQGLRRGDYDFEPRHRGTAIYFAT